MKMFANEVKKEASEILSNNMNDFYANGGVKTIIKKKKKGAK